MAARAIPINYEVLANLVELGAIDPAGFTFKNVSFESGKFVACIVKNADGSGGLVLIDMRSGAPVVTRRKMAASAVIMNPVSQVMALRDDAGNMQVLNLEMRSKVKTYQLPAGTTVEYWRWISPNTIAYVTPSAVFHWSMDGDAPVKMFDRHASLSGTQLINYQCSADMKWLLVVGIKPGGAPGTVDGAMQLYSVEKRVSQALSGHTGVFSQVSLPGRDTPATMLSFAEKKAGVPGPPKFYAMEVGAADGTAPFRVAPQDIPVPAEAVGDFAVQMLATKNDVAFMLTKLGYLYLFDIHTGTPWYRQRISEQTLFRAVLTEDGMAVQGVSARTGLLVKISLNPANIVPYIMSVLRNRKLALGLAGRLGLPGADDIFREEFEAKMSTNDIKGAATLAASSPEGVLRNERTISMFQSLPAVPGQPAPLLQYFSTLLELGKLNKIETLALARPVLQGGRGQLLQKWLVADKLECSEELGDMLAPYDANMALSVYLRSGTAHEKVVNCFVQTQQWDKIVAYATKTGFVPDYSFILGQLIQRDAKAAQEFALKLANNEPRLLDINTTVDIFMGFSALQETTSFLLDVLKGDRKEEGYLQTRLLEINLLGGAAQVADAILQREMFSHYDAARIAMLCEKAGLYQRALEHYTEIEDIKRVIINTHAMPQEFLVPYFGNLSAENSMLCLRELLSHNMSANLALVVKIATEYSEPMTPEALVPLFEEFDTSFNGLYHYLGAIVNTSDNAEVHFMYLKACTHVNMLSEAERICKDSEVLDGERAMEFLLQFRLPDGRIPDPRPLIRLCDKNGYIAELTKYLYENQLHKHIEAYVERVSPAQTPKVVDKLLEMRGNEEFIRNMLMLVKDGCPVDELVAVCEERNSLKLLQPWLEARLRAGDTEPATHDALGKLICRENSAAAAPFIRENAYYRPEVLGKFLEDIDPNLALLCYSLAGTRGFPKCDEDLLRVSNNYGLFREQARYLIKEQNPDMWAIVLDDENPHRRFLIDQVTQTALPEVENPEDVTATVKAFMRAKLPNELIGLLKKLVLTTSSSSKPKFASNRNLQNLLIITAIKCSKDPDAPEGRVMDFIHRLDNFDGLEIAKIARAEQYGLYEEAFEIYRKYDHHVDAVDILVSCLDALDRAGDYANRVNEPEVWLRLASAQLGSGQVHDAIDSYIKSGDAADFVRVIEIAQQESLYEELVKYLHMARQKVKDRRIDTELIHALAKTERLGDLEEFIASPNVADIQAIGDRCFDEGLYQASRLLFNNINNNAKLASALIKLSLYREAVEAARKANSLRTWKEVNAACVSVGEFRLAQVCGLYIIVSPDHLESLIEHYTRHGYFDELISLLEQGLGLENAHPGIFTELGICYSKYKPDSGKLMEHIKIFWGRVNIPKLLVACEAGHHWEEAAYLYRESGDFDRAVRVMMEHSTTAFTHEKFLEDVQKARNMELYYEAITFYLEEEPIKLERLLHVLTPKLDHARVVRQLRDSDNLPLVVTYLRDVQKENIQAVNEALNEIYVDEEDHDSLRSSIAEFDNFDSVALARRLEAHELLEFRRVAAALFKRNKRWSDSIALSKKDKLYKDAIVTAADSGSQEIAEDLLNFFVRVDDKEAFCATLYQCYDLIRTDFALELAWRNHLMDYTMPFLINTMRELNSRIVELETRTAPAPEAAPEMAAPEPPVGMSGVPAIAAMPFNPSGVGPIAPEMATGGYTTGVPATGGYPMPAPGGYPTGMPGMPPPAGGMPGMGGMPVWQG